MRVNHSALRVIRERTGHSQAEMARLTGIPRPNYAHIEAGRRPGTAKQIKTIAQILAVPVTAIIDSDEDAA